MVRWSRVRDFWYSSQAKCWLTRFRNRSEAHVLRCSPRGPRRAMRVNSYQNGLTRAQVTLWPQWEPQMASLAHLFQNDHRGPPRASEGAQLFTHARRSASSSRRAMWLSRLMCERWSAWSTHEIWLSELRRGTLETVVNTWASSDVGQKPPGWRHTCSCGPLTTMEPSNGRSSITFRKWSSWTACGLWWTICNAWGQCVQEGLTRRCVHDVELNRSLRARRSAWPTHKMWLWTEN